VLNLHERLEDQFVYGPLRDEVEADSLLGTWAVEHDEDVALIKQQLQQADGIKAGTPAWQMAVASAFELLSKHVLVEENEIFGRIEQRWSQERLADVGAQMEAIVTTESTSTGAARKRSHAQAVARA
jgi:hemerythrin-like domain-containing protein